jgi:AraC-like DNA-binding protein
LKGAFAVKDTVQIQPGHCSEIDPRRLFSVAREVIATPTQPLIHQGARFLYVSKGEGTLLLQGRGYRLREGTLVAIMPWQISEVTEVSAPLTYYLIRYQLDAVNLALKSLCSIAQDDEELLSRIEAAPVVICGGRGAERIDSIVGLLQAEPEDSDGGHSSAYAISLIIELMILFCRQGQGKEGRASAAAGGRSEAALLRYIYTHLNEKLTITELSAMFYMSEGSIRKYIREVSGLSFFDLLAEMRVTRTMNFLLYTDFTLEEIAGILGYVDASHMSKVFAARMGTKAGEYRKTYQLISEQCGIRETRRAYDIVCSIYRNYAEKLTAESVAKEFGISRDELQRMLLCLVEKNFDSFLNYVRVQQACRLLTTTAATITSIAIEVGYNTVKSFTRNFLRFMVMTPSSYRKAAQGAMGK